MDVDHKMLDEVASDFEYDGCIRFEFKKPSPVVKMPRGPMFNKEIAADVVYYKGKPILHVMCTFTAYCQAFLLESATGAAAVRCLFDHWIRFFGIPEVLFSTLRKFVASEKRMPLK